MGYGRSHEIGHVVAPEMTPFEHEDGYYYGNGMNDNDVMANDQDIEKNARKKGKKKKNSKKSKKPFGGANEDVVFVEFLQ